jgi:hypothetical protein
MTGNRHAVLYLMGQIFDQALFQQDLFFFRQGTIILRGDEKDVFHLITQCIDLGVDKLNLTGKEYLGDR